MISQRFKRKFASAGLVSLATVGLALGASTTAHAMDQMINMYDTQSQCYGAKFYYEGYDPSGSYYCSNDHEAGPWNLWKR